jgi:4-amino-4-deoxy-L-arabinose transferase-like glycosyltransferase
MRYGKRVTDARGRWLLLVILAAFAFLHLHRMGELSWTWDEGSDLNTVNCLQRTADPFACMDDISQTRLPFYIHAVAGKLFAGTRPHFLISFAFSMVTLLAVYAYARREYGALTATLFAALYATSPQLLTAGRMVLTHSHIIATAFSTLSFLALFEHQRTGKSRWLIACAVASGAAAASSVLAIFNGIVLLAFYRRRAWRDWIFLPIAAATFFATSIIYVKPAVFAQLVEACRLGKVFTFWNYLGLGRSSAPWYFPFLLLAIKVGPWLVGLFVAIRMRAEGAARFAIAFLIVLILKGAVFGYETPHHQVQFYPLLYLFIAAGLARVWRPWVAVVVGLLFIAQIVDVVRFFPNYLFYGSQYGQRFIGEFYGPAVIHAQGREDAYAMIATLPESTVFLVADNNIYERSGPRYVPFTQRDPKAHYEYALVDRLYATHFAFPERDAFNAYLAAHCVPYRTIYFPPHVWMYRVMRCR